MTDLYDAIRGAMTPDGRVRMTLELLTAMHEEGERRSRVDDAMRSPAMQDAIEAAIEAARRRGYAESDRDTLDAMGESHDTPVHIALVHYRERFAALMRERADERAETAERELEGAEREADDQRERRKRAEVERDAAHARAEKAERELVEMRADRDSWRQQCEDARSDALRYGRERDNLLAIIHRDVGELAELSAHARACLDPEIVSRDPAHARLAALVERIEGGRAYEQADDWQRRAEKAERGRDELAAQLAALREAAARYVHSLGEDEETHPTLGRVFVSRDDDGAEDALDEALADTAPAVEAYTRRVQAEALESAAKRANAEGGEEAHSWALWMMERAAEIRGGRCCSRRRS